jgi:G3E family GTPase
VIVEPSGIYDVDEFFDVLREEPLDRWYEIGNVITIMDLHMMESRLSDVGEYFILSQVSRAGLLVMSHVQEADSPNSGAVVSYLNGIMEKFRCDRRFESSDVLMKDWGQLTDEDYERIHSCGWRLSDHIKLPLEDGHDFSSVCFLNLGLSVRQMEKTAAMLLRDKSLGEILRIKGFHQENGKWYELNASRSAVTVQECGAGQEVWIVIGEGLDEKQLRNYISDGGAKYG